MKTKLLYLLILSAFIGNAQTVPSYKNIKITGNTSSVTATKVNVQEADGLVNTKPLSEFGTVTSVTGTDGITVAAGTTTPVIGISSISQLKVVGLVTDLGNKVDKVSGERLINAIEISKLANQSGTNTGDQDLSGKVDKVAGSSLITNAEITRLGTLANYTHPTNHSPSIITQDANNRFVTDVEKATWNAKQAALGYTPYNSTNPNGYETPSQLSTRDTNNRSRANHTGVQAISTVTGLQTTLDGKQTNLGYTPENAVNKNIANGYAGLGIDGKLISSQLPDITISDTFVTASQAAMLALTAQTGDVSVRTDLNKSFILKGVNSTVLADWQELLTPTSTVTTVFGRNGAITAQSGDYTKAQVGLSNVPNTDFTSAVTANTAKVSFDATSSTRLGNTSGTNTGDQTLTSLGAAPSSGSANYIQNGTSQQSANLNISGNGFFGGNVGIGTTSPNNKLTISNAGASGFEFNPTTGDIFTFNRQSSVFTPMVFSASSYNFNVGAATFSSSVTATEFLAGLSGQTTFIGSVQTGNIMQIGGSQELRLQTYDNGWKDRLTFVNNGAATFASSVTATTFILPSNSNPVTINTNALSLQQGYNASFISAYRSGGIKTELYFTSNATIFDSNVTASGFFQSSDKRLKNIYKRDGDVAYFKWKNGSDDKMHIGYIAQEVKKEFPDQVNKDDKGMLSVNYIEVLVAKIQDLEKRISELEKSK